MSINPDCMLSVGELAKCLNVSLMTVDNSLLELEKINKVGKRKIILFHDKSKPDVTKDTRHTIEDLI